jgi:archaellum component FlaC
MVVTELKFERMMGELDDLRDTISDLSGEFNTILDRESPVELDGTIPEEAMTAMRALDNEMDELDLQIDDIAKELGISRESLDFHMDSCIVNRWEIYAKLKGAKIVNLTERV